MKEQSKSEKDFVVTFEEGLQQEKQEYISKLKYYTICCKQWIRCIRLIFLLELTLFFGWGCYMILQSYHSRVMENEVTDIIRERYLPEMFESVSEVQKSHPATKEMPVIFVKPEIITDKLNNFLGGIESSKEQGKTIVIDVDSIMPTSTQNSISMLSNNMMEASDINNSPMTSPSEDLVYNKEFMKNLMPWKIISSEDSFNNKGFLEKLQNIAKSIEISDLEPFENSYDFTEDANRLALNNQKDRALDTSNEIESLGLDVTTSANLKDSMNFKINFNFDNSLQNLRQKFLDLMKIEMQDDHDEKKNGFLEAWTDKQENTSLELDLVICPPYRSSESSDMSSEHLNTNSSISQSVSVLELLERIKNILSNDSTKNKDKHDADDSNMSMSILFDAFASESDEHFAFDTQIPIVQNIQDHHSSEITANTKEEEAKYNLMKNINSIDSEFLQPKIQDIAESSTPNVKFQWFNAPPTFANDLQFGLKDISGSTQNPSLEDTIENTETNTFIPGKNKSRIQCQTELKMNVLRIKCPVMMIDEEWNFTSSGIHVNDFLNVNNFKDNFFNMDDYNDDYDKDESKQSRDKLISNENSDKKVASLQHSVPKVTDAVELQENMPVRSLKNAFDFTFKIDSFDEPEIDKNDEINSPDKEEIKQEISSSSTTISSFTSESDSDIVNLKKEFNPLLEIFHMYQQKQFKVTEEQDLLNFKNAEIFFENNKRVYDLEKKLISIFNDEMLNIIKQKYLSSVESFSTDDYSDYICSITNICSSFQNSYRQLYVELKKFLESRNDTHNHDNPSDIGNDYNYRKKRMTDDLTEQYEQVSNTLEEINKNVNVLQDLKKIFQRMEVLAACIDTLHERHLFNNKLDDDYVSNEFSMEITNTENQI
ncbi:cytadherence high molecular weight protein 1 isoform X2 [Polyergus mexicanus]|uniref:cytadherence high molecular weight protein 1 isoform X2 n=1 Tax=Polyergus mexicanus TaxID=615972 RepID=UPI0038B4C2D2